jgi:hypothetical protein
MACVLEEMLADGLLRDKVRPYSFAGKKEKEKKREKKRK